MTAKFVSKPLIPYSYDPVDEQYELPERPSLPFDVGSGSGDPVARYTAGQEPWRVPEHGSHFDDLPAGMPVRYAKDFMPPGDLNTLVDAVAASLPSSGVIVLEPGIYQLTTLQNLQTWPAADFRGTWDKSRKIVGFIGAERQYDAFGNVTSESIIQAPATMISSTPNAADYAFSRVAPQLNGITCMYMSNSGAAQPHFFSGVTFDGDWQTPFRTFTTGAQGPFARNDGVASPAPFNGLNLIGSQPGSIVQYCRFRGFSSGYTSAPPYEAGSAQTNGANGLIIRNTEIDGRVPAYLNSSRPRQGGGWMQNKEADITFQNVWEHHTRRSGNALNTNTNRTSDVYRYENLQLEEIANIDASDPFPSDASALPGGFNGWNVEAVVGRIYITNCRANIQHSHISWVLPYQGSSGNIYVAPSHTVYTIAGFRTDDTLYGGCLRIRVTGAGTSPAYPAYAKLASLGIAGSGFFDVRWNVGDADQMIGIRHTEWNARQAASGDAATFYPKERYFVVIY